MPTISNDLVRITDHALSSCIAIIKSVTFFVCKEKVKFYSIVENDLLFLSTYIF